MFNKTYEQRLQAWSDFRNDLETVEDPYQSVCDFFQYAPLVNYQADPYDPESWPTPWELIKENIYCPFVKILAICYTLQLTDRFSGVDFEIHITHNEEDIIYLLTVNGRCMGYDLDVISTDNIPKNLTYEKTYTMPDLC